VDDCCGTGNLWLLGLVSGYTMGNFIHILLVIAIIIVLGQSHSGAETVVAIGSVLTFHTNYREE